VFTRNQILLSSDVTVSCRPTEFCVACAGRSVSIFVRRQKIWSDDKNFVQKWCFV
jgi:hypothetical protein